MDNRFFYAVVLKVIVIKQIKGKIDIKLKGITLDFQIRKFLHLILLEILY